MVVSVCIEVLCVRIEVLGVLRYWVCVCIEVLGVCIEVLSVCKLCMY